MSSNALFAFIHDELRVYVMIAVAFLAIFAGLLSLHVAAMYWLLRSMVQKQL